MGNHSCVQLGQVPIDTGRSIVLFFDRSVSFDGDSVAHRRVFGTIGMALGNCTDFPYRKDIEDIYSLTSRIYVYIMRAMNRTHYSFYFRELL